jgi:DNA (cytosine-5)-methyltransferase 1
MGRILQHFSTMPSKSAILSLFCGCGGFDLGFTQAGFRVALALDINRDAVNTYNLNHKEAVAEECDLSAESPKAIFARLSKNTSDSLLKGVIGGAPCQSFSQGNVYFDPDDIRHTLPKKYARILAYLNRGNALDFFVFENVEGITSKRHQESFHSLRFARI